MFVRTPLKKTDESRQGKENLLDSTRSDHTLAFTTEHTLPPHTVTRCAWIAWCSRNRCECTKPSYMVVKKEEGAVWKIYFLFSFTGAVSMKNLTIASWSSRFSYAVRRSGRTRSKRDETPFGLHANLGYWGHNATASESRVKWNCSWEQWKR